MKQHPKRFALILIFVLSLLAMVGSLYYSYFGDPVANFFSGNRFSLLNGLTPCTLCWYQRIALYPIVLLSGLALLKHDYKISQYITPLALIASFLSLYQYALEQKWITDSGVCLPNAGVSCGDVPIVYFNFITLALMGFVVSVIILIASYSISIYHKKHK